MLVGANDGAIDKVDLPIELAGGIGPQAFLKLRSHVGRQAAAPVWIMVCEDHQHTSVQ
jgi:hypothetical protein